MKFGEFELGKKIGAGGMGAVWKARHPRRTESFAAKVANHPRATLPEFRQRFEREVRAMAKLRHPNVVRVFDYGVYEGPVGPEAPQRGTPWVVLEYAPGGELEPEAVDDWESLRTALGGLLKGLAHSHSRGLVHRDIKPQNILWAERRGVLVPAVADFGIAHALDRQKPSYGDKFTSRNAEEATGTPRYMAPEQFMGLWRDYGPATDLYAVGILAYFLACGDAPFKGDNLYQYAAKHMEAPFPELRPTFDVPDHFEAWVRSLTQKAPRDRPRSAGAALAALDGEQTRFSTSWRAVEPDDEPGRAPVGVGLFGLQRTYLVGRETQRAALWQALGEARQGKVVSRVLVGANGTGKSRLADWVVELGVESDAIGTVFRASFSRERAETSGLAWMLAEHLRCVGMKSDVLAERLEELLGERWEDEERRALQQVLSQAESVGADVTAPTVKESMVFEMCRRIIDEAEGPVAVLLDDVDEDPSGASLRFMEALATWETDGLLVVATAQNAVEGVEPIQVAPLEADAFRRLLRDELGLSVAISGVVERVADGNPQFALQVLEHWTRDGALQVLDGEMTLTDEDIPTTLEAIWSARVAQLSTRLSDEALPVLTAAGVLGSPIEPTEWLATAAELGVDVESPLFGDVATAMIEAGLGQWDDSDRMRLVHRTVAPLLADVGGPGVTRRSHGAAARALSSLYSSNERGLTMRVARHFNDSGQPMLGWIALESALQAALDVVDAAEIAEVADAMLESLDATGAAEDDARRVRATAYRAIAMVTSSREDDRDRGAKLLDRACELAQALDAETVAQVEGVRAWSAISRGGRDEAAKRLESLIADTRATDRTRLMNRMFLTHLNTYRHDDNGVRHHAKIVLQNATPTAWKLRAREALIHRALSARDAEEAKRHAFPALVLAKQLGRLHLEVHIENLAGFIADLDEDFARAEAHHERAERLAGIVQPQSAVRLMAREYRARAMLAQSKFLPARELFWSLADEADAGRARVHPWDGLFATGVALADETAISRAEPRAWDLPNANALHVRTAEIAAHFLIERGLSPSFLHTALTTFEAAPGITDTELETLRRLAPQ